MNIVEYTARMAAAHREFTDAVVAMLGASGRIQTVFTDLVRDVDTSIGDLKESNEELRRLVLEQGANLRAQGVELRALRERLNGGENA